MTKKSERGLVETGVRNLDTVFTGGLPRGSLVVVTGPPGSGKTIFAQQMCFHNASPQSRVLYFSTLSEPTAKTLRYIQQFSFFDKKKIGASVKFVDLGIMLRSKGLEQAATLIMTHVKQVKPAIVVIDSFKVFDDLAASKEEVRKFTYEIALKLMAWEATVLLLGEYATSDYERNPLFSIIDGILVLSQREDNGENQRFIRMFKLRGADHSREDHAFVITRDGLELFAPRVSIRREPARGEQGRCKTNIAKLDEILGPGIPWGSSLLVSGVAGTGKTLLGLAFLYRGALAGEKGILISFEETEDRLLATATALGWDVASQIERGMLEIIFVPQPNIRVETHLFMIRERVQAMQAKRVVLDSVSVFLHKVSDPQAVRDRIFHLCSIVQNAQAVGFFATDIPYGSHQISRFGVEETVVDGVIILSSTEEGFERQRYVEIYKLRNTAHLKGRHNMTIGPEGISVFPRYGKDSQQSTPPPALEVGRRLASGVPGLDELMGGGLLKNSVTMLSGSAGIGKSTLGSQFLLEGAIKGERGLFITLEAGPDQLIATSEALGVPLGAAIKEGTIECLYMAREDIRPGQFLSVLDDKIRALHATRLVLDSVTHLAENMTQDDLRHLLHKLVVRFRTLGVTSVVTIEASSLHHGDRASERGVSLIADNLLVARYARTAYGMEPILAVVKTRGSAHDFGRHAIVIEHGGMRVQPRRQPDESSGDRRPPRLPAEKKPSRP